MVSKVEHPALVLVGVVEVVEDSTPHSPLHLGFAVFAQNKAAHPPFLAVWLGPGDPQKDFRS